MDYSCIEEKAIQLTEVENHMKYSGRAQRLNADRLGARNRHRCAFFL